MTYEQDREDLQHHADEMDTHESFNYALFDDGRDRGPRVRLHRPDGQAGRRRRHSWWVVDEHVGTELDPALDALVPRWIAAEWPCRSPATEAET
jgi:hypothetical protein